MQRFGVSCLVMVVTGTASADYVEDPSHERALVAAYANAERVVHQATELARQFERARDGGSIVQAQCLGPLTQDAVAMAQLAIRRLRSLYRALNRDGALVRLHAEVIFVVSLKLRENIRTASRCDMVDIPWASPRVALIDHWLPMLSIEQVRDRSRRTFSR